MLTNKICSTKDEIKQKQKALFGKIKKCHSIETLEIILDVLGTNFTDFFKNTNDHKIIFSKDEQYIKSFDNYNHCHLLEEIFRHF